MSDIISYETRRAVRRHLGRDSYREVPMGRRGWRGRWVLAADGGREAIFDVAADAVLYLQVNRDMGLREAWDRVRLMFAIESTIPRCWPRWHHPSEQLLASPRGALLAPTAPRPPPASNPGAVMRRV